MAITTVTTTMAGAINYTVVTDTSADWPSVANSTYFYDKADKLVHYKDSAGTVQEIFSGSGITVGTTTVTSGTDGRVFFQAGGVLQQSANLFWDNSNNRLGVGTSSPGQTLDVSGNSRFQFGTIESGINITGNSGSTTAAILIGTGTLGTSGSLEIWRNGAFALQFVSNIANLGTTYTRLKQGAGLTITGSGGSSTAANSLTLGSNAADAGVFTATSGTQNTVNIGTSTNDVWSPSSGTATYNLLRINPRTNTSGSYSGIVRGILIDPTLTSTTGVTYRAIETTTGDVIFASTSGNVAIGSSSPGARLDVRAQGALSTDIAFRVRNSVDTVDLFSVRGNGEMYIPNVNNNTSNFIYYDTSLSLLKYTNGNNACIALGQGATFSNATFYNTVIGSSSTAGASAGFGIALGFNTLVNSSGGIAIGDRARTSGVDTIVIGNTGGVTTYSGTRSIYLGKKGNNGNNFGSDDVFMTHFNSDNSSTLIRANGSLGLLGQQAYIFTNGTGTFGTDTFMGNGGNTFIVRNHPSVPSLNITDSFQQYSADIVAGNAAPHFRTENGAIVKVYQETTAVAASTFVTNTSGILNDTATFDGYTIGQVVKALRNLGILA